MQIYSEQLVLLLLSYYSNDASKEVLVSLTSKKNACDRWPRKLRNFLNPRPLEMLLGSVVRVYKYAMEQAVILYSAQQKYSKDSEVEALN